MVMIQLKLYGNEI